MKLDRFLLAATLCVLAAAVVIGALKWKDRTTPAAVVPEPGAASLLVVGVEGLEPSIVERLVAEGKLPNMSRLLAEGAVVRFPSLGRGVDGRITWTSLVTGVKPERQGVGAMVQSPKGNMAPLPLKPSSRTVDTVWTLLSKSGTERGRAGLARHLAGRAGERNHDGPLRHVRSRPRPRPAEGRRPSIRRRRTRRLTPSSARGTHTRGAPSPAS